MKRLVFSVIILASIILTAVCGSAVLLGKTGSLENELNECMSCCAADDREGALRKAEDIAAFAEKNEDLFNVFFNHNDVNGLFTLMPMLPVYALAGTQELYIRAAECLTLLQGIRRGILPLQDMIL